MKPVEVVAAPDPFSGERLYAEVPEGLTLAEIISGSKLPVELPVRVFVDDHLVPRRLLHLVRPRAGRRVTIVMTVHGGGGSSGSSGGGKDTLRTVLTIGVIAASIFAPFALPLIGLNAGATIVGGLTVGGLASAVVGTAGLMAVNALVPPRVGASSSLAQISSPSGASAARTSPNYAISGARNAAQQFGAVPQPLGVNRMVPPLGAATFVEILGGEQYLRMIVVWGYGPLDISDIRIGDTPIGNFSGVSVQTVTNSESPLSLYPNTVTPLSLAITLSQSSGAHVRQTAPDTDQIGLDFIFPGGLVEFDENGNRTARSVTLKIEQRAIGGGAWTLVQNLTVTQASTEPVRRGVSITVARGQYEIRASRITPDSSSARVQDSAQWIGMNSFRNEDPIQFEHGLAKTAIRIRATDQLNSVVDQINGLVKSRAKSWNGSAWIDGIVTNNPADLFRHVLQGNANPTPVADADIDLASLAGWHEYCDNMGFRFNQVRDFAASVWDALADIAAAGRASPAIRDGKWTVVVDNEKTQVVQQFTPRNSWGFTGEKAFGDLPHAWRVKFINEAKDYRQDERIVYDDGFSAANATRFEAIEFPGVTDPELIWKHGRYHIAVARLRPETYSFFADVENIVCTFGDLLRMQHDVTLWGIASGRVKAVAGDGGNPEQALSVNVDEVCTMEAGRNYSIRFRLADGGSLLKSVATAPGEQTVLQFTSPYDLSDGPLAGDLFSFGETGSETIELVVRNIQPGDDFTARVECVDYAPAIQSADAGAIPAFNSQITLPPHFARERPAAPVIRTIQSDLAVAARGDDGSILEKIVITTDPPLAFTPSQVVLQAQIRREGADEFGDTVTQGHATRVTIDGVIGGEIYDVRIRRITTAETGSPGVVSDWHTLPDYKVIGKTDLPDDVTQVWIEGDRVVWDYTRPLDFKGFLLRFNRGSGAEWTGAQPAHEGFISETSFNVAHLRGGPFVLLIKAVDLGGRESANAAVLATDLGDPFIANLVLSTDFKANGFFLATDQGSVTNGAVDPVDNKLKAADTTLFWGVSDDRFWGAGDDPFWTTSFAQMTYEGYLVPRPEFGGEISLLTEISGESHTIEYRTNGDAPAWSADDALPAWDADDSSPAWGAVPVYRAWPGKLGALSRQRHYFRIITSGAGARGIVSKLTVQQDAPDLIEEFNSVPIAPGGSRLVLTKPFQKVVNIKMDLEDDGGDAVTPKIMDKAAVPGPLIQAFDVNGGGAAARLDVTVKGY